MFANSIVADYIPPDTPGFFDEIAWAEHEKYKAFVENNIQNVHYIDGSDDRETISNFITEKISKITGIGWITDLDYLWISSRALSISCASEFVSDTACGAISLFIGTTRDNFKGKKVVRLEYETYESMAQQQLKKLSSELRKENPDISKICIFHRLGEVPVSDASVIIAISSPHRDTAMNATRRAIEVLKKSVPIWKKEVYSDGSCSWKQNSECTWNEN